MLHETTPENASGDPFMRIWPIAAASCCLAASASISASARPVVVELFTSEGCSSCPPADSFLADLARTRPDVLALDFHVTYWDQLGWRDPWALASATRRQDFYAAALRQSDVYTPEMVIDGRVGLVGSDRQAAMTAIGRLAVDDGAAVPIRLARRADGTVALDVGAGAGSGRIVLVGFDPAHDTPIGAGENDGRVLHEANVVRSLVDAGAWTGRATTLDLAVPSGSRVAALLQAPDGRILGASVLS